MEPWLYLGNYFQSSSSSSNAASATNVIGGAAVAAAILRNSATAGDPGTAGASTDADASVRDVAGGTQVETVDVN